MTVYEVYQPATHGPEMLNTGTLISRHRTPEAAGRAIATALRRLRRQPGMGSSWYDWEVRAVEAGDRRPLSDAEADRLREGQEAHWRGTVPR